MALSLLYAEFPRIMHFGELLDPLEKLRRTLHPFFFFWLFLFFFSWTAALLLSDTVDTVIDGLVID